MPTATKDIKGALFEAQEKLLALELEKNARNPHFKNRYVTLDALLDKVLPVLREHDILFSQPTYETATGDLGLVTELYHVPSQTSIVSSMPLNKLQRDDPQGQGSAITYARRYSLMSLLGLVADEDDDGNAAGGKTERKKATTSRRSTSGGDDW